MGAMDDIRQRQLGDFLRARRAAQRPEDHGIPASASPRRVRGLRREEVARLAYISTDYYTRIEQGRLEASAAVLADLADTLRLDTDNRSYMFELAGKVDEKARPRQLGIQVPLQRALDDLVTTPAFVLGRRTDILGWNRLGAALIADFGAIPIAERNFLRLLVTEPAMRLLYADWREVVELAVAQLRGDSSRWPDDQRLADLVADLSARDDEFAAIWASHDVAGRGTGSKTLHHPRVGTLVLDWEILASALDPDQQIVLWTAARGSVTHERLQRLAEL